jgi:SAM-dependent methyltransferase
MLNIHPPVMAPVAHRVWAQTWCSASAALLDRIGVQPGAICADIGCGGEGILPLLHQRAGQDGCVIGVDRDGDALAAAEHLCKVEALTSVRLIHEDVLHLTLPRDVFDLVHARFLLASLLRPERGVQTLVDLARPGGIVALQEIDHASWSLRPQPAAWSSLKAMLEAGHGLRGDPNIGRRLEALLCAAGLEAVTVRPVVLRLRDRHPFMRASVRGMDNVGWQSVHAGLATAAELDDLLAEVDCALDDPCTVMTTFTVVQAWGRKRVGR